MKLKFLTIVVFILMLGTSAMADESTAVTVYNQSLALVRQIKTFTLPTGIGNVSFTEVPALLDPTSVHFMPIDRSASLLEQNFDYSLVNSTKLLEAYIGKEILLIDDQKGTQSSVTLLSASSGLIVKDSGGKILINPAGRVALPKMIDGLYLRPTLNWLVSAKGGSHECEVSYLTGGLSWSADYVLLLVDSGNSADLDGWVTMNNNSGATYNNALLKLVAGDVNVVQPMMARAAGSTSEMQDMAFAEPTMTQENLADYHMYTLQRPTDLADRQTKQLALMSASSITTRMKYYYTGGKSVRVFVEFKNDEASKLGMPLPAGRLRVFKRDSKGIPQFIGEDRINHTPKNEEIKVNIGSAFDIVGDEIQVNYRNFDRYNETDMIIEIRNRKEVPVEVIVERYSYGDWEIINSSSKYEKKGNNSFRFVVNCAPDGTSTITWTLRNWIKPRR